MPLYNASAQAIKSVHPSLRVGGPATANLIDLANFTAAADAAKIPWDFVSSHKCGDVLLLKRFTAPGCLAASEKRHCLSDV